MSEVINSPVESPEETSGSIGKKEDLVPYSTYKKALSEKQNTKSELDKYKSEYEKAMDKIKQYDERLLESEGKKDELLDKYKKELDETKSLLTTKEKTFAWKTITSTIKEEALRNGCTNPDKLIKLLDDSDLKGLEIGDDYTIEQASLKQLIEKSKAENAFLFNKTVAIATGTPNNNSPQKKASSERELFESYIDSIYKK